MHVGSEAFRDTGHSSRAPRLPPAPGSPARARGRPWKDLAAVPGLSSSSRGFTQPKGGEQGKTESQTNRNALVKRRTWLKVPVHGLSTEGQKPPKEKGVISALLQKLPFTGPAPVTAFFPHLRLRAVPRQTVTIQGDKTVSLRDAPNASQASRARTGGRRALHRADPLRALVSTPSGHSGNQHEKTSCEGRCPMAEAHQP